MHSRFWLRVLGASIAIGGTVVACGARTGLLEPPEVIPTDGAVDQFVADVHHDGPLHEGGPLDVSTDCPDSGPYCDPSDLGYVWQCGVRTYQCSSLEQCYQGQCRNPCMDTLGQDTSNGCEFYALEMDVTPETAGVCYAVFVVNQWKTGEPAKLEVDLGGTTLPIEQFARIPSGFGTSVTYGPFSASAGLAKDQIAILFLSRDPAAQMDPNPISPRRLADCPAGVTPAIVGDASLHGTGTGTAFHLKSNVPVVAYQMLPYGAGRARVTGATLLLPTNVWDTNYVAANAYAPPTAFMEDRAGPTMTIIAQADATSVSIFPTADILAGGGLSGTPANSTGTYTINKGQYLQFTQAAELTGSAILASAPVAVIGGSTLMDVPTAVIRADSAEQMLFPVHALGSEYAAVRYRSRDTSSEEFVPWRIVGVVDGTKLTFDPPQSGAPTTIDARQFVEFEESGPFVVRSQDADHPFYFASYMTGGEPYDGTGDPEYVSVISPAQYLPRYTFFTDPTYPETNLVIVRAKDQDTGTFPDVALDCAGVLTGWQAIDSTGKYQFTRVDLSTGDFMPVGKCDNGVHTIEGNLPVDGSAGKARFGVTVWGWGNPVTWAPDEEDNPKFTRWVSYGYPAGANVSKLNSVVLPAK